MRTVAHNTFLTLALLLGLTMAVGCETDPPPISAVSTSALPELPDATTARDAPRGPERDRRDLTLALVGEVRGELEPCGCPTLPYGGFERRHTQLDRLRNDAPGPVFHIDLGDTLVKGIATSRGDNIQARAEEMLRLSRMVGVDLWIPGASDLVALSGKAIADIDSPAVASATWVDAASGELLLPPFAVLKRGGVRVGVVGLSARPQGTDAVAYRPVVDAVEQTLPLLPQDLDWVIAAGNIADAEAEAVAAIEGVSAVFSTRGESYTDPPQGRSERVVIETPDRGRYLQVVHARLGTDAGRPLLLHPDPPEWRARLAGVRRGETDAFVARGAGRNLGLVNTIPLSGDLDREGAVSTRLGTYRNEQRIRAAKTAATEPDTGPRYASSGSCVNCHSDEFARWTLTSHAKAWRSLVERRETDNPECIECHTTGYGEPGGFGELSTTNIRKYKGVQCEGCHGPLGGHPNAAHVKSTPITEASCTGCHDEANSPDFDYAKYMAQASCQGGAPELVPRPPDP